MIRINLEPPARGYDAWLLYSGEINCDVSGEVNAQQLTMISLFHRNRGRFGDLRTAVAPPRSSSLEIKNIAPHPFFRVCS